MRSWSLLPLFLLSASLITAQDMPSTQGDGPRHETTAKFRRLGAVVRATKEIDFATGFERFTAVDQSGRAVDYNALVAVERSLAQQPQNKLHPGLVQALKYSGDQALDIVVWCQFEAKDVDHRDIMTSMLEAGEPLSSAQAAMRARVAAGNQIALARGREALARIGLVERSASTYAPVIFSRASAAEIALLAECPEVDTLYVENKTGAVETDNAVATHRWDRVFDFGLRGDGMQIAIIEDDGVANNHPAINHAGFWNPGSPNIGEHATTCASIAVSTDGTYPGHARGAQILSGNAQNYSDANLTAATDWSITQGADVVNMSFLVSATLTMVYLDRYVDYQVRFTTTTFTKSAGNQASGCGVGTGPVTSPGLAWNNIAVGNVQDQDNADWDDDVMRASSSWDNPTSTNGDRQKPELSAVGTSMMAASAAGGFINQGSGTSYAAPGIAGMCAALMSANNTLAGWPELMKAVMMSASWHNVEGASRLSECDGAGAINGLAAYRMVEARTFTNGTLTPASFAATGYVVHNVYLQGGDKTRITLCWDSLANSTYATDVLNADLDIAILAGANMTAGAVLASSASYDNSYEIVEFVPPSTGWYSVRINDFRFDGASEYYGLAWSQHAQGRYARFRPWLPDVPGSDLAGPALGNQYFWMDPIDSVNGNHNYALLGSAGTSTGYDFPSGRHSYGDLDALTYLFLDPANPYFLNFTGVYAANGTTYSNRLAIPDLPGLEGLTLYFSEFTLDGAAPDSIKEIGVLEPVTIQNHAVDLPAGDDTTTVVNMQFSFPFFAGSYTQCWINSNGNVTFTAGDTSYTETLAAFLAGLPKIAPFWDDLNTNIGGKIRYRSSATEFVVEWVDVPEFGTTTANQNSAMLILKADGTILIKYRDCSLIDGLVGISAGGGATGAEYNISNGLKRNAGAIHELFLGTGGAENFDLGIASSYRHELKFKRISSTTYQLTVDGANF